MKVFLNVSEYSIILEGYVFWLVPVFNPRSSGFIFKQLELDFEG